MSRPIRLVRLQALGIQQNADRFPVTLTRPATGGLVVAADDGPRFDLPADTAVQFLLGDPVLVEVGLSRPCYLTLE
jgi:hypothetical protein